MASLAELLDYDNKKKQALSALQAGADVINRGSIAGTLGAPVDLANMALGAVGLGSENPVLGSEWIGQKMQKAGMVSPERRPLAEFAAGFVNPETAATKGVMLAKALASKSAPLHAMMVFHGTPHTFESTVDNALGEFSAEKIGKGEGKQVYGYGTYVAESPTVGKNFQETLKSRNYASIQQNAPNSYKVVAKDGTVLADNVLYGKARKLKEEHDLAQKGNLYTADLPDEMIDKMLHWDKPLSEQNEFVKNALIKTGDPTIIKMVNEVPVNKGDYWEFLGNTYNSKQEALKDATGAEITFGRTGLGNSPKEVSEKLLAAGIPGVQYMQPHGTQELRNTRNFVIFPGEEKKAKIIKRE